MCITSKETNMPAKKPSTKSVNASAKKPAVKKEKTPASTAPAPVATETPVVAQNTVEEVSVLQHMTDRFNEVLAQLDAQRKTISETIKQVREMQKQVSRNVKVLEKRANRRKPRKQGEHKPSGFAKEALVSDELAKFLGKPSGTMMARTQVTKEINAYIKKHKLQDPNQGKIINPDKRLKTLLRVGSGEELTYFNLQKYMKHLFPKPAVVESTA